MKWQITKHDFPNYDSDTTVHTDVATVWEMLYGVDMQFVTDEMFSTSDPLEWMKIFNETNQIRESYLVWDMEANAILLE